MSRRPAGDSIDVHVGKRVRERRVQLGMSQKISRRPWASASSRFRRTSAAPTASVASRMFELSKVLDVPVSFFFDDLPPQPPIKSVVTKKPWRKTATCFPGPPELARDPGSARRLLHDHQPAAAQAPADLHPRPAPGAQGSLGFRIRAGPPPDLFRAGAGLFRPMNDIPVLAGLSFVKMHGLGNDFVVLDERRSGCAWIPAGWRRSPTAAPAWAATSYSCSSPPTDPAGRRVHAHLQQRWRRGRSLRQRHAAASALCWRARRTAARFRSRPPPACSKSVVERDGRVEGRHGPGLLGWKKIPLARECDTNHVPVAAGPLSDACCVNMGNPHAVFFVRRRRRRSTCRAVGPVLEHDPMFPERANIGVAQICRRSQRAAHPPARVRSAAPA